MMLVAVAALVANFDAAPALEQSPLRDFTFLAVASPDEASLLEQAAREAGLIVGEHKEQREGGTFRDLDLALPDGRQGTLSIRESAATGKMADGRPAPTLWMHVGAAGP